MVRPDTKGKELMATRQPRSTAPAAQPQRETPTAAIPAAWGTEDTEAFSGHNPTDKADLVGVPFMVIGAQIDRTERNDGSVYDIAWIYALDVNGTEFEFSDASAGVREQIRAVLHEKGMNPAAGGGFQGPLRMRVMGGLRFNTFKVTDDETGKKRDATTYYFTSEGGRPTA